MITKTEPSNFKWVPVYNWEEFKMKEGEMSYKINWRYYYAGPPTPQTHIQISNTKTLRQRQNDNDQEGTDAFRQKMQSENQE